MTDRYEPQIDTAYEQALQPVSPRLALYVNGERKMVALDTPSGRTLIDKGAFLARESEGSVVVSRTPGFSECPACGREVMVLPYKDGLKLRIHGSPMPGRKWCEGSHHSLDGLDEAIALHPAGSAR